MLYIPKPPPVERTLVAVARNEGKRIQYGEVIGPPGKAQEAVEEALSGKSRAEAGIRRISEQLNVEETDTQRSAALQPDNERLMAETSTAYETPEMTQVFTGKLSEDGSIELRSDTVARENPKAGEPRGVVNILKTKAKAKTMINEGKGGIRVPPRDKNKPRKTARERAEEAGQLMLKLSGLEDHGNAIRMNLLSKSGLTENRVMRDLNILEASVSEAAHHLRADELLPALNRHFGLDRLKKADKQADGCTIASLLMMNAAMLHQRISNGGWLTGVSDLSVVKNDVNVVRRIVREWNNIRAHDFRPVLEPALAAIDAIEETNKTAGLERALHHIAAEAERIAETYADMGADHAGPLFNRVMGNQASDGAFFTRPVAASIAARLTLDACGEQDWTDPRTWQKHKTVDLACGSGTLLAAILTDMKRRAGQQGADMESLTQLQKLAVEDVIKGLDINPVSLQLAASQLTAGNQRVSYRRMGLHLMPYGPDRDNPDRVRAGTLELLGQSAIVSKRGQMDLGDDAIGSQATWESADDAELEDAVDAAKNARIVIMNPPFSRRAKMGEKFPESTKQQLHAQIDIMARNLILSDTEMNAFIDKNAPRPLFVALAEKVVEQYPHSIMTMVSPTAALTGTSGRNERRVLAQRFHIDTVLTSHQPQSINLSQHTNINESIVVMRRHTGNRPPTRFINLDRMPVDDSQVVDFHQCLLDCEEGLMTNGWGEVSHWPAERIEAGDWTAAIWRSSELAAAGTDFANHEELISMGQYGISPHRTSDEILRSCQRTEDNPPGSLQILESAGQDGQYRIESQPEGSWITKTPDEKRRRANGGTYAEIDKILKKSSYLLVPFRQDNISARLNAVAASEKHVGTGWMPVSEVSDQEGKSIAVFMNSTAGRLQLMRNTGMKLTYPTYPPAAYVNLRIPDIKDARIVSILAACWERTKDIVVPQFRDGECEVRRLWDEAVAEAMGWDAADLTRLRLLLHQEPHVRGLGYGQYADELNIRPTDRERFLELADQWESEAILLSSTNQAIKHPVYQTIVSMGEPAVPLILQRMQSRGGRWFTALRDVTGVNPVKPADRGNVPAMQEAWLKWGERNGYD